MPTYVLVCEDPDCDRRFRERVMSIPEREAFRCTCGSPVTNDYSRQKTTNFSLTGNGWPGKMNTLETKILKDGSG